MPRGGRRSGRPGASYGNRTDLNAAQNKPLPITAAPAAQYGDATAQMNAQRAVPMAPGPAPVVPAAPPPPAGVNPAAPPAQPMPQPGSFGAFDRPTDRPNEPVTAGLATGPGPGPEALGNIGPTPQTAADLLSRLANRSPEISALLAKAQSGGL